MNGLAIVEKTETETRGIFIDQDTVEMTRQNARVSKRIAQEEAMKRKAALTRRKAEKAEAQRKAYNRHTIGQTMLDIGIIVAATLAGTAGMIHPAIFIPVSLFCLCRACVRLGAWFGRGAKK